MAHIVSDQKILIIFVCSKVNLTYRYYARKVNSYLKIDQLKDEWKQFLALPDEQQPLEKGKNTKSGNNLLTCYNLLKL